jgi:hypothetical protein
LVTGAGSVYSVTPPAAPGGAWTFNQLYEFSCNEDDSCPNGSEPSAAPVIRSNGVLYGTASNGGLGEPSVAYGVIFSLTPPVAPGGAWSEQTLYEFHNENDGTSPTQVIMTRNGVIYGIANDWFTGGRLGGGIFAFQP